MFGLVKVNIKKLHTVQMHNNSGFYYIVVQYK